MLTSKSRYSFWMSFRFIENCITFPMNFLDLFLFYDSYATRIVI